MKYILIIILIFMLEACSSNQRGVNDVSLTIHENYPDKISECGINFKTKELYLSKSKVEYFYDSAERYDLAYSKYEKCIEEEESIQTSNQWPGNIEKLEKKLECMKLSQSIEPTTKYIRSPPEKGAERKYYVALTSYISKNIGSLNSDRKMKMMLGLSLTNEGKIYRLELIKPSGDRHFDFQVVKSVCLMDNFPKQEEFFNNDYGVVNATIILNYDPPNEL